MWRLRGTTLLAPDDDEEVVVVYAKDLIKWLRDQNNETCSGIADWVDICAMDLLRQKQEM